ncbi:MAG: hypothetical protein ABS69_08945 [Nitrosomonadales bacterium SCN 54-20]|nr:MAG: hypothetical protein ABS69_08945 [Nitrosomonadales bacterium SCN 54-20]
MPDRSEEFGSAWEYGLRADRPAVLEAGKSIKSIFSESLLKKAPWFSYPQLTGKAVLHGHCHQNVLAQNKLKYRATSSRQRERDL